MRGYGLRVTGYGLQVTGYGLRVRVRVGVRVRVSAEVAVVVRHLYHVHVRGEDEPGRAEHAGSVHPVYLLVRGRGRPVTNRDAHRDIQVGGDCVDEVSMYTGYAYL